MSRKIFSEGQKVGRLRIGERIRENGETSYFCQCECGTQKYVRHSNLRSGNVNSCGCLAKELLSARAKPLKDVLINKTQTSYKRNARIRGYEWSLSNEDYIDLINKNCFYCGSMPYHEVKHYYKDKEAGLPFNGIDRVDNKLGYTKDNCVTCCRTCNSAKGELSFEEFKEWANKLHSNINKDLIK